MAHLLRELQYLSELNDKQDWSDKIASLFREAIHERNSNPSAIIPKASWLERLDNLLKLNICNLGKKFETLKKGLIKCRDYIFNFLEDPMIPSDNNGSERGIRKLKIKLKNSCTFRSDFGQMHFLNYIQSLKQLRNTTRLRSMQFKPYLRLDTPPCPFAE